MSLGQAASKQLFVALHDLANKTKWKKIMIEILDLPLPKANAEKKRDAE